MRVSEIDKMIATLESLERVDKTADYHKSMASVFKGMVTAFEESGFTRPEAIRIVIRLANGKSDAEGN